MAAGPVGPFGDERAEEPPGATDVVGSDEPLDPSDHVHGAVNDKLPVDVGLAVHVVVAGFDFVDPVFAEHELEARQGFLLPLDRRVAGNGRGGGRACSLLSKSTPTRLSS